MRALVSSIGLGEVLALFSAVTFATSQVLIRLGMQTATPVATAFIINGVVSVCGLAVSLYRGTLLDSGWMPLFWFAATGMIGPGVGRLSYFIGITRMGLNRSVTITSSTPLWSTLIAVFALGERPSAWTLAGTLGIVCGVSLLSLRQGESQTFRSWFTGALIFPLIASLAYAIPPIFVKFAFVYQKTPEVGIAVAFSVANAFLFLTRPLLPGKGAVSVDRAGFAWIFAAGLFSAASSFLLWTAVMVGDVSTTMPLSRTAPFLILILSYFFLGKMETITRRTILGIAFVVIGGVLITIFH